MESYVDIPNISRWLSHKDGGALAMRVYGHLRQEHSLRGGRLEEVVALVRALRS